MRRTSLLSFLLFFGILFVINPTPAEGLPIYDEDFTLGVKKYTNYSISVSAVPAYVQIEIICNEPIQVLIFNNTEAQKWTTGQSAWGYIYHNITNLDLVHQFSSVDQWYIFVYNKYSDTSTREGHIIISEVTDYPSTGVLFDQSYSLSAKTYTTYAFWVYDSPTYLHLEINTNQKIQVLILNETEAMKWYNGEAVWGYIYHNITNLDLYHALYEYDVWYIILYNRYTETTTASGDITLTKVIDRPSTGEMFDQDFSLGPKAQTTYSFWVYDSPTTLHIELFSEDNLELILFNETEAMKWMNGELATGYFFQNVSNVDLYHRIYTYDTWYIFVYNRYSSISPATGHITVTKVADRPSSEVMFDQGYSLGSFHYSTYAFWTYEAPTFVHIEVNSNENLLVLLMNETEALKWISGESALAYQFHVRDLLDMNQILTEYDVWYIILYNKETLSTVVGHVTITKTTTFEGPSIDQPARITYEEGESGHSITWHPRDDNPASYIIYREGQEITSKVWNGSSISISVDNLPTGEYNYTIVIYDGNGNSARDTAFVTVTAKPTTTTVPETTDTTTIPTTTTESSEDTTTTTTEIPKTTTESPTTTPEISPSFSFLVILLLLPAVRYIRKQR